MEPDLDLRLTPVPGSAEERAAFERLQANFPAMYRRVFSDPKAARTVVVVPSMSLDTRELAKIDGVIHYEERLLCLLMLLRFPRTQIVYLTSLPIDPVIVDYYLHLLPKVPAEHARKRLTMLSCGDAGLTPLTAKLLARPELLETVRTSIWHPDAAHLSCFNSTHLEQTLAVQLGIPMYAADPRLSDLGRKTQCRTILRDAGLAVPDGFEDLRDEDDVVAAVVALHQRNPGARRAVIKLNDGFSGEGNAVVTLDRLGDAQNAARELRRRVLQDLTFVAPSETIEGFFEKFRAMGGIVEIMIEGKKKRSPSVQMRIDPLGALHLLSTHDQVLTGTHGQVFEGCTFPARNAYRLHLHDAAYRVGAILRDRGVIGRFAVDFVSVKGAGGWQHYAIEINLRKGGTTLPYLMLEFLTNGRYDPETGVFRTPTGEPRSYYATDNVVRPAFRDLAPSEVIDLAVLHDLLYDAPAQQGVVFHLLGAVTDHGKLGMVSIAPDRRTSLQRYHSAVSTLERAALEARSAAAHH